MLDLLNDDCRVEIFKYLNLNDQISLYLATKGVSNRLNSNVIDAWKYQLRFRLDWRNYEKFEEMPEMLDTFLTSIQATMQELELEMVSIKFLERWEKYTFPNMKSLKYTIDTGYWYDYKTDDEIKIMANLFPGLRSVKPDGDFKTDVLTKWTQLRKLDLSKWSNVDDDDDNEWLKNIGKCQLLKDLTLDLQSLRFDNLDPLLTLPKLQTITVTRESDAFLAQMLEKRGNDVYKIFFYDCFGSFSMTTLRKLRKLRHLILVDYENPASSKNLPELIANLKHLEQLDVFFFSIWSTEADLWQTVASCPSLKILAMHYSDCMEADFFESNRRTMEETLNNRSHPLTLYCHRTYSNEDRIRKRFNHPRLKLSFDLPVDIPDDDGRFLQIHFKPLHEA